MSDDVRSPYKASRRSILRSSLIAGLGLGLPLRTFAASNSGTAICPVGLDPTTMTIAGMPVLTQANPGTMAANHAEHKISIGYFKATGYAVGLTTTEDRILLAVDVGNAPATGMYHPLEAGMSATLNTITDIYVFNQADGKLLFWRKLASGDTSPSAMFLVPPGVAAIAPKVTVVARCSQHGLWGADFDLASGTMDYAMVVATFDSTKTAGGSTLLRPYVSFSATGGQGNLGIEHRPNAILTAADQLTVFLGGDLNGNGKHARDGETHYVMGAALYDQNGNMLANRVNLYSADNVFTFANLGLVAKGVKTVRLVVFDSLNGRFMSFLDL